MKVFLFVPCFINHLYPSVGLATWRVLERAGNFVVYKPHGCCGQPAYNAGWEEPALITARNTQVIISEEEHDVVVVPSASCTAFMKKHWEHKKPIYELTQFLVDVLGWVPENAYFPAKVTYHDSCSALRDLNISYQPRQLLKSIDGLGLVEMSHRDRCCGFGGTFSVKFTDVSVAMGQFKLREALKTKAQFVVSTDQSCFMHLESLSEALGYSLRFLHIAEILALSLNLLKDEDLAEFQWREG
ncbi:MAG: (Fe-S)-binding protein [Chlorobi bacterium]|nr:(Fe-S)-binding protein [Chlorobiota bacterium]